MKIDKQKAKIDFLRDRYKNYFIVVFALLGSIVGIAFQVVIGKIPIWILFILLVGLLLVLILFKSMKELKSDIIKLINELEEM